jgi:hypothetical protein
MRDPLLLDADAAWASVAALTWVSQECAQESRQLQVVAVPGWSGAAADAFYGALASLPPRLDEVALLASYASSAVATYAQELQECQRLLHRADAVRRGIENGVLGEGGLRPAVAEKRFEAASRAAAQRLAELRVGVPGRPLTGGDHSRMFVERAWRSGVVEPLQLAWGLSGQAVTDNARWRENLRAVADGIGATLADPKAAARDAIAWDEFQDGLFGAGAGELLGTMLGGGVGRQAIKGREEHRRSLDPPGGDLPPPQSVLEMLAQVDLARHEHLARGHTITRHVDIDDIGLRRRLFSSDRIPMASRFTDLETANAAVTDVLRLHADALQRFTTSSTKELQLVAALNRNVGVVLAHGSAVLSRQPQVGHVVDVRLKKADGQVFVVTAMVVR